jgi:hypothetical protein
MCRRRAVHEQGRLKNEAERVGLWAETSLQRNAETETEAADQAEAVVATDVSGGPTVQSAPLRITCR